jgi:hypothetical protein
MKSFKDREGMEWAVRIDVAAAKSVREALAFDILNLEDGKTMERLIDDPVLLCDVLYVVCKDQADSRQISDVQFGRAMGGDAIEHAAMALLSELVDFFPGRKGRTLAKALAMTKTIEAKMNDRAQAILDDPALEAKIEEALLSRGTRGESSTVAQQSSAANPIG